LRRVTFHPLAEREIARAARYYISESEQLGTDFATEVEQTVSRIQRNPMAAVRVETEARRRLCKRFPYAVVYRLLNDEIHIIAVSHLRRRSGYWRRRR